MPYRLRVTEEEVRQELIKMGFTGLSDDTVAAIRKDLLKMIKSDLRKLKQGRQDEKYTDSSNDFSSAAIENTKHTHSQFSARSTEASVSAPQKIYTKKKCYSSLSASHTSEDKDESTKESGYSESESSTSCVTEAASISLSDSFPQGQSSTKIQKKKEKDVLTRENFREKNKAVSSSNVEPKVITKTKPVEKKGLPEYPSRPDPVRLYHYYKAHWDQYKIPGEDPRLKLRWAIRSKLFYAE